MTVGTPKAAAVEGAAGGAVEVAMDVAPGAAVEVGAGAAVEVEMEVGAGAAVEVAMEVGTAVTGAEVVVSIRAWHPSLFDSLPDPQGSAL